jgi:hypothetical protein
MAEPRHHRRRRLGLILGGSLLAHAGLFWAAANDYVRPFGVTSGAAERATPVAFVPLPPAQVRKTQRPKPHAEPRPRAALAAVGQVRTIADGEVRLAAALGPPTRFATPELPGADQIDSGSGAAAQLADGAPRDRYPINPGYWQVVEHWLLINRTERYCVEPQNIVRFMAAPCNHIYTCSYPVQVFEADKFRFEGVVLGHNERFSVKGGGDYTPTSLHVSARFLGHYKVVPLLIRGSIDGQYLGADCPADAKRIRQR